MPESDKQMMHDTSCKGAAAIAVPEADVRPISVTETEAKYQMTFPFTVAAPSFVLPAGVAENSRFLADFFPEICLLFFESEACLAYGETDLPPDLADLPVSWHMHLPLDLPWDNGVDAVWDVIGGLMDKGARFEPGNFVLHPPDKPEQLHDLGVLLRSKGVDPAHFLLENVHDNDLRDCWEIIREDDFSVCLDLGHILAYGQRSMLTLPGLWDRTEMLHLYAPAPSGSKHVSMAGLGKNGRCLLRDILTRFKGRIVTLEVFEETGLFQSLELLAKLIAYWEAKK